jgi:hypothetical protein
MQPDNPSTQSVHDEGSHDVHPSGGGIHLLLKFLYVIAIGVWINVTFCIAAVEDRGVDVHERVDVESRQNDVVRSGKERHSYVI